MNGKRSFFGWIVAAGMTLLCAAAPVLAQGGARGGSDSPFCTPDREAIINLRPPIFGTPSVWDAALADAQGGMMEFAAAHMLESGHVLVAGLAMEDDFRAREVVLAEINPRGRVVAEGRAAAKTGERPVALLTQGDRGYMVLSTILAGAKNEERQARLSLHGADYAFRRDLVLKDAAFDHVALGLSAVAEGAGAMVMIEAINRRNPQDRHAVLYRVDEAGRVLWQRAYRPGIPNRIYGLAPLPGGQYAAVGEIRHEDGRMSGWAMRLNADGTIVWQRTYPRGDHALLRAAMPLPAGPGRESGNHLILTGQVMPHGGNPGAAWVMEIDAIGAIRWQRYLRGGGYDFDGRMALPLADGRVVVLANAAAAADGYSDHIRLLTLSPRGRIMEDESYMEGIAAQARHIVRGRGGERIVSAVIQTSASDRARAQEVELITDALIRREREAAETAAQPLPGAEDLRAMIADDIPADIPDEIRSEGWVFIATPPDPYADPCIPPQAQPAR